MNRKIFVLLMAVMLSFGFGVNVYASETETREILDITMKSDREMESISYSVATHKKVENVLKNALNDVKVGVDLSAYGISYSDFITIFDSVLDNNHRYFYVSGSSYSIVNGNITNINFRYKYDRSIIKDMLKKYDKAVAEALSEVSDSWSDMEKALYINDYLAQNCTYDSTYSKSTAYDALVNKTSVCQGYAEAYKALLSELGIPCEVVSSDSINHAWNMIEIDGMRYHVDVTWNDPVGTILGEARHTYFMKSTVYFKESHYKENDWEVTGDWEASSANTTTYDNYIWVTKQLQ